LLTIEEIEFALAELSKREYSHYREVVERLEKLENSLKKLKNEGSLRN